MGDVEGSPFARTGPPPPRKPRPAGRLPSRHLFLPTSRADLEARGWDEVDIIVVSGDAYVDHPSFGPVLIARFLEGRGFRVGLLPQPDWRSKDAFAELGRPRLFFGVSAGNLDSMLNRLTSQKKNRSEDQYSPDGQPGCRPDRATLVYANRCREAFPDAPVVLGGIEASLRRIAHYDYWSDKVRRSMLVDAKADLLIFGMGERPVWELATRLDAATRSDGEARAATREDLRALSDIRGTAFMVDDATASGIEADPAIRASDRKPVVLPSYEEVSVDKVAYARMARAFQHETNPGNARPLLQRHGDRAVYYNPPAIPLDDGDAVGDGLIGMDELYDLPFVRAPHPMYDGARIPAYDTVKHSVVMMRGCFGGCTFCSITEHEGRVIQNRSAASVLREVRAVRRMGDFRGTITDIGGPTANMYKMKCRDPNIERSCRKLSCVHPRVCQNLVSDHAPVIDVMKQVREEEGVKHVFIASGVRFDLAQLSPEYVEELATHHVGGHLSVAPEHTSDRVLNKMKKPGIESYERFKAMFQCASKDAGKEQYEIPYFISGHPGCALEDMVDLALWLKREGYRPRQVQDFIPTPMSIASAMYWTGIDPLTMEPVHVATGLREKKLQKALLMYWNAEWWDLAREALVACGRADLIGHGPECLVPPPGRERGRRGPGGRSRKPGRGGRRTDRR